MLRTVFLIVLIFALTKISLAQERATTESGKSVLLFDNGTWQYEEQMEKTPAIETGIILAPAINIDSTREFTTEPKELFYLQSPRLERYFGEIGSNIRCKLSSSNSHGTVKIQFNWEFPVVDGNRYFGSFREGTKVIFTLFDDQKVELVMGDENSMKQIEKHNYSLIANSSYPLTNEQLVALTSQPIRKIEVGWKKKSEEYEIENSRFLMDTLPTVF